MKSESKLLEELKAGKPDAVRVWFEQYQTKLLNLVQSRIDDAHDVDEIVQETFINCMRQINIFRGDSSLWTWMQSIARHEIADYYRKRYAKKAIKTIPLADFLLVESDQKFDEAVDRVEIILAKMENYTQELLKLKYIDKKKVVEIAQLFNKSVKTIESELYRARLQFKSLWEAEFGTFSLAWREA